MTTTHDVPVSAARAALPEVLERARTEPVALTRRGKRIAVVVSADWWERANEALEDAADAAAFDAAMAEGGPTLPWAQVRRDLGL